MSCKNFETQNTNIKNNTISIKEKIIGKWVRGETFRRDADTIYKYCEFTESNYYSVRTDETFVDKYKIDGVNIIVYRSYFYNGQQHNLKIVFEYLNDSTLIQKSTGVTYFKKR